MALIKMMRGDSYIVFVNLTQQGYPLTADMVTDVEICVGENLRKTYSGGEVGYDTLRSMWYFRPSQSETLALDEGTYEVIVRVKYSPVQDADVKGIPVGRITMLDTHSQEVI
jgi:hypothetical protein